MEPPKTPQSPIMRTATSMRSLLRSPAPPEKTPARCVFAWGWGLNGQLGHELTGAPYNQREGSSFPVHVTRLRPHGITQVECGSRCSVVCTTKGKVYTFGRGGDGQLGVEGLAGNSSAPQLVERLSTHTIVGISCKGSHVAAVSDQFELWTWGRGDEGQLGHGNTESVFVPQRVAALAEVRVVKASTGRQHTVALSDDGTVYVMGCGTDGQLGLGTSQSVLFPEKLEAHGLDSVTDISCGSRHTVALTESGQVYSWGWNAYGQVGVGHCATVFIPTLVNLAPEATCAVAIACGFRHSFAKTADGKWYGWGWNQDKQLGHNVAHGVGHACESPSECELINALGHAVEVKGGGRHSLARTGEGKVYTFGRGADGQLGHSDLQSRDTPEMVAALQGHKVLTFGCGWAHTLVVTEPREEEEGGGGEGVRGPLVTRGDWDAFFGVFFNVLINLILITSLCTSVVSMEASFVNDRILPGTGLALLCGSSFFGLQGRQLGLSRGYPSTALPFGLDTPIMLSTVFLIMGPEYQQTGSIRKAWRLGLFSAFIVGILQIAGAFVGDWLRAHVPRAALLAALAGIGLSFIAEGFAFQIFNEPLIGFVAVVIVWAAYAANVSLPFGIPGSMAAVLAGTALGFIGWGVGGTDWKPFDQHVDHSPHFLHFAVNDLVNAIGSGDAWKQMPLIVPLCIINVVGSLVNLESAASVGDAYNTRVSMIAAGTCTLIGVVFGNPFPCCIFLGHGAWKAVGARTSYAFMCGLVAAAFCFFNGVTALLQIVPLESTVGILMWVGLAVTAQAYETMPNERPQLVAVTVGILPALASWIQQSVANYLGIAGGSFVDVADSAASLNMHGMISFSQGFLLLAVLLATLMVNVTEWHFHKAAAVCLLLSACSFVGFIHSYRFTETKTIEPEVKLGAANEEAVAYLLCFAVFAFLHAAGYTQDEQSLSLAQLPKRVRAALARVGIGRSDMVQPLLRYDDQHE